MVGEKTLHQHYGCRLTCHMVNLRAQRLAGLYGRFPSKSSTNTAHAAEPSLPTKPISGNRFSIPTNKLVAGYPNRMPSFQIHTFSEEQILDLIEYIKSLSRVVDSDGSFQFRPAAGPATQPTDCRARIENPPFSNYQAQTNNWITSMASHPLHARIPDSPARPILNDEVLDRLLAADQRPQLHRRAST